MDYEFGVCGMGVMGASLALNLERNRIPVVVYNYTYDLTEKFLNRAGPDKQVLGARTVYEFMNALKRPRCILIMVTAGDAVDSVIKMLKPHLEPGDILIDGGNSHFSDTENRIDGLEGTGIQYVGMGVSGGEQGALWGPSLMPGGDEGVYRYLEPYFQRISAKAGNDEPCVSYIGTRSAGHFVKMVHNGIEYGDMQLIAEAYDLMRYGLGLTSDELAKIFAAWNTTELRSYLVEITAQICDFPDDMGTEKVLVDQILDRAGMKGTGTWTGHAALNLGEPIPTIISALHARALSGLDEERALAQEAFGSKVAQLPGSPQDWVDKIKSAMYASKICSYAQGFVLLRRASQEYKYSLNMAEIARIWRGGCIIRADFLDKITQAFQDNPDLINLLVDEAFVKEIRPLAADWRDVVAAGLSHCIPLPAMSASLTYFEALRRDRLPANLIQAQRDLFGAHTYQRIDRPGNFHTEWGSREGDESESG